MKNPIGKIIDEDNNKKVNWTSSYLKVMIIIHRFFYIISIPLILVIYGFIAITYLISGHFFLAIFVLIVALLAIVLGVIPILYALDYVYKKAIKKTK